MIQPYILGSGSAGKAIQKSLAVLGVLHPEWEIAPPVKLGRTTNWETVTPDEGSILFVANPHALHARAIEEGERAGFRYIVTEKPACVSVSEIERLRRVKADVGVFHGYRQMWGPQCVREMIESGELGEVIAVEGRYWQSSAAQRAVSPMERKAGWKDDPELSGPHDTLVDLGAHWADMANFLVGEKAVGGAVWMSKVNGETPHRDTHVHLTLEFSKDRRAIGSISKTFHGMGNHLEISVIASHGAAQWSFASPDEVILGQGSRRSIIARSHCNKRGSAQAPFHGLGWLEGYVDISARMIKRMQGDAGAKIPTLSENLDMLDLLLRLPKASA